MLNALTIDVEDYYMVSAFADRIKFEDWHRYESRIEKNTYTILEMLDEYGIKATFFILGWVAEQHPKLVKDIHSAGHEIASHGYNHTLIYNQTPEEFRKDIRKTKNILEDITATSVMGYRATSFSVTEKTMWALDILIDEGFLYDSSIFPVHHDRYGNPNFNRFPEIIKNGVGEILEIPLSTIRLFRKNIPIAGGGYLRFFPLRFIEWGIRSLNRNEAQPATIYFHPWEIDPEQPRLNGSKLAELRHYTNISKTFLKLNRLLKAFQFGPLKEVFANKITRPLSFQ